MSRKIKFTPGAGLLLALFLLLPASQAASAQQGGTAAKPAPAASPSPEKPSAPVVTVIKPTGSDVKSERVTESLVDEKVTEDQGVNSIITPYAVKVRGLENVIGRLEGDLEKKGTGGGAMGNFVADAMRASAEAKLGKRVDLAVTNKGGLRKTSITAGELRVRDIFELMPFENALMVVRLSGADLKRLLDVMMSGDEPAQSGARIRYRVNQDKKKEIVSVKLVGPDGSEREVDPAATYLVVTHDYIINVGGRYSFLKELSPQFVGITLRDSVIDYVKAASAGGRAVRATLDGRYVSENPANEEAEKPQ